MVLPIYVGILLTSTDTRNFSQYSGADPGFQVRGGGRTLKKSRRAEGGAKIFGVFRVKNHDFTPKNHIFSNFRGGGARRVRPPLDPPLVLGYDSHLLLFKTTKKLYRTLQLLF